ncbi:MAG: hypothetical protein HKN47_03710, partial [Pirellulaceae bacterium]|nr:hypothetical protein [Pirellulaceae bacterium]
MTSQRIVSPQRPRQAAASHRYAAASQRRAAAPQRRSGIILLVVLAMLAFLSLLVVTYVAFSSSARRTADSLARAEFRAPDVNGLFDDAMLKLVRGTNDPTDPMFGEDLLSDYFGRKGSLTVRVMPPLSLNNGGGSFMPSRRPVHLGGGFVRLPIDFAHHFTGASTTPAGPTRPLASRLDDYYSGRTITFLEGPLENQSFRVLRSIGARQASTPGYQNTDSFYIELDPGHFVTLGNGVRVQISSLISSGNPHDVGVLFYAPDGNPNAPNEWGAPTINDDQSEGPGNSIVGNLAEAGYPYNDGTVSTDDVPYEIHINPAPLNAAGFGVGFSGSTQTWDKDFTVEGKAVPNVFFPNIWDGSATINKSPDSIVRSGVTVAGYNGDFDENYDAPDYNNWFLSGRVRVSDGAGGFVDRVIPSFHRPSVINYLVNLVDWEQTSNNQSLRQVLEAYRRATFRPLPFTFSNPQFTGGNTDYA